MNNEVLLFIIAIILVSAFIWGGIWGPVWGPVWGVINKGLSSSQATVSQRPSSLKAGEGKDEATASSPSPTASSKTTQTKKIIQQVPKESTVPVTKPKSDISPYSGKVKISNIRTQTSYYSSLITLTTSLQKDEKIDITGWEFKTKNGSFLIPKGLEQINPLYPALLAQDIIAKQWDIIYISSDLSPFLERDKNFRPNKCMGYLSGFRNFTIPLPQTCPWPQIDKLPSYINYWCQQYINTLGSCQAPTSEGMTKYDLFKDDNCVYYLNSNLNYNGCFSNYQKDQDFSSNQWHIYLDRRDREIFPWNNIKFDTLYLRDKNGLLVDKYEFGQRVCCD
jgi:hypothetical protein